MVRGRPGEAQPRNQAVKWTVAFAPCPEQVVDAPNDSPVFACLAIGLLMHGRTPLRGFAGSLLRPRCAVRCTRSSALHSLPPCRPRPQRLPLATAEHTVATSQGLPQDAIAAIGPEERAPSPEDAGTRSQLRSRTGAGREEAARQLPRLQTSKSGWPPSCRRRSRDSCAQQAQGGEAETFGGPGPSSPGLSSVSSRREGYVGHVRMSMPGCAL